MDASAWDERYRAEGLVWGGPPNRWVVEELSDAPAGVALDLACGEGRNALWLAAQGWRVIAVDFSAVAIDKARELDTRRAGRVGRRRRDDLHARANRSTSRCCATCSCRRPPRRSAVRHAAAALAPGGTLLVIAHDSRNLTDGTGGPSDPRVLYTAGDVATDLEGTGLVSDRASEVFRPVPGSERPAIDALLRARRPAAV